MIFKGLALAGLQVIGWLAMTVHGRQGLDQCFDGVYWMDPTSTVPAERMACPFGYQPAALLDIEAHQRAAILVHGCRGPGAVVWIGKTVGGATHGGNLALMAPKSLEPHAQAADRQGGVVQPRGLPALSVLCERKPDFK